MAPAKGAVFITRGSSQADRWRLTDLSNDDDLREFSPDLLAVIGWELVAQSSIADFILT
jgi:hypothetical protein